MARIVRCTIEMEMREFEHFNKFQIDGLSDAQIIERAKVGFLATLSPAALDETLGLWDYIEAKIVEEPS